ncbi:UTP--glucose-1-phosphate uridylyltransferase, partial [Bacillus safensis]|nr:UTP--glucose-1-phosphate uridylyltransferase [Bacillus safensis]
RVFAYDFEGKRYDVGEKQGFIETTLEFALQDEELKKKLIPFMKQLLEKEEVN